MKITCYVTQQGPEASRAQRDRNLVMAVMEDLSLGRLDTSVNVDLDIVPVELSKKKNQSGKFVIDNNDKIILGQGHKQER